MVKPTCQDVPLEQLNVSAVKPKKSFAYKETSQ